MILYILLYIYIHVYNIYDRRIVQSCGEEKRKNGGERERERDRDRERETERERKVASSEKR